MLSFKIFLQEAKDRPSEKEVTDVMKYFTGPASTALTAIKNGDVLYRGLSSKLPHQITLLDTAGMKRTSAGTNNVYQLMMDSSSSLKSFPSRSKSLICTTNIKGTRIYGWPHIILPFNETDMAVSALDDFIVQELFDFGGEPVEITDVADSFLRVFKLLGINPQDAKAGKFTSLSELDKELAKIDFTDAELLRKLFSASRYSEDTSLIQMLRKAPKGKALSTMAEKIFTPGNMSISLIRFGSPLPDDQREVWFTGKALAFHPSAFLEVLNNLSAKGYAVNDNMKRSIENESRYF